MGKILRYSVLLGILSLGLLSCSSDDYYHGLDLRYSHLGRIEAHDGDIDNGFDIRLDDGTWLAINNANAVRNVDDTDRIIFKYTVLSEAEPIDGDKRFIAVLNYYQKVLSKPPVLQSFINEDYEHRQDSIGYNPIRVDAAWFGGQYLNIWFSVARRWNTNELHFINLVADDVDSDGVLDVYLRHNGYDDVPAAGSGNFTYSQSLVSFDLAGLVPEGQDEITIRLNWEQYRGSDWETTFEKSEDMGKFVPYGTKRNGLNTDNGDYVPGENFR